MKLTLNLFLMCIYFACMQFWKPPSLKTWRKKSFLLIVIPNSLVIVEAFPWLPALPHPCMEDRSGVLTVKLQWSWRKLHKVEVKWLFTIFFFFFLLQFLVLLFCLWRWSKVFIDWLPTTAPQFCTIFLLFKKCLLFTGGASQSRGTFFS